MAAELGSEDLGDKLSSPTQLDASGRNGYIPELSALIAKVDKKHRLASIGKEILLGSYHGSDRPVGCRWDAKPSSPGLAVLTSASSSGLLSLTSPQASTWAHSPTGATQRQRTF